MPKMLYQQGTQRIEIIVRKDRTGSLKGAEETDTDNVSANQTADSSGKRSSASARFLKVNISHGVAVAKQIANQSINFVVQGIGQRYGDEALQENVERRMEIVSDVTNFASSVGMGALYGSAGGFVGMAIGAALGAVSSLSSIAFKYAGRERDFDYKQFKENNAIEYKRARASINLTTGRLR